MKGIALSPCICVCAIASVAFDVCAQEPRCAPPASSVTEAASVVRLRFANGKTVTLTDEPAGDGQTDYRYRDYIATIGYHLVELTLWAGPTTWLEAYAAGTGLKMVLDSAPVVSPDGLRFVTVGRGAPREPLVKRIQVRSRTLTGEFPTEWDFELPLWARGREPLDWGPVNPRWLTVTSLRFDRVDRRGMNAGTATATLLDQTWQFTVDQR